MTWWWHCSCCPGFSYIHTYISVIFLSTIVMWDTSFIRPVLRYSGWLKTIDFSKGVCLKLTLKSSVCMFDVITVIFDLISTPFPCQACCAFYSLWQSEERVTVTELFLFCDVHSLFLLFFIVLFVCLSLLFSCVSFSVLATVFLFLINLSWVEYIDH